MLEFYFLIRMGAAVSEARVSRGRAVLGMSNELRRKVIPLGVMPVYDEMGRGESGLAYLLDRVETTASFDLIDCNAGHLSVPVLVISLFSFSLSLGGSSGNISSSIALNGSSPNLFMLSWLSLSEVKCPLSSCFFVS